MMRIVAKEIFISGFTGPKEFAGIITSDEYWKVTDDCITLKRRNEARTAIQEHPVVSDITDYAEEVTPTYIIKLEMSTPIYHAIDILKDTLKEPLTTWMSNE